MTDAFIISFFNTMIMLVWFKTEAIIEYCYKIPFVSKYIIQYKKSLSAGIQSNFISFLLLNYNSFFVRLITCPYCINFWLTIATSFFVGFEFFAFIYVTSMIYYKLISLISNYESR